MKSIGGYFDLELPKSKISPYSEAISLSTGRACLALWIKEVKPKFCFIPFYSCDALAKPLKEAQIHFEYYKIDELFNPQLIPYESEDDVWIIFTNFFGLLSNQIFKLNYKWNGRVLVDNTHSFFDAKVEGLWSFTSARKYFGVPDGAYCFRPNGDNSLYNLERLIPDRIDYLLSRYTIHADDGFQLYQNAEIFLDDSLKRISNFSESILSSIDIKKIQKIRKRNYTVLLKNFANKNLINNDLLENPESPFCYPLLPSKPIVKENLYKKKLFIPTFWPEIHSRNQKGFEFEKMLAKNLLPLPIDHRYTEEDMDIMSSIIIDLLK